MSESTDHQFTEGDALHRVELRTAYLIERYGALRQEVELLRDQNSLLRSQLAKETTRAEGLEQKLALRAPISADDPDVRKSAESLYGEIDNLVETVDDVLRLLETHTK
ncbi:hypothetical protein [uncultured Porphyromonas sp.]|uniref:hypothetical protein n=1 Tax=uncultured Porphyromonas sp. TaxID=159274 RepID=UPI00261B8A9E|nr:hypothetical protein [uncultured Porphyromonas sp.]